MTDLKAANPKGSEHRLQSGQGRLRGGLVLLMGCLALAAPSFAGPPALFLCGLLLIASGVLEMLETFHSAGGPGWGSSNLGGEVSILAGILLLNKPELMLRAWPWCWRDCF
jgi:uncharacterized membrane protein HdeD (DUF308 family)